MCQTRLIQNSNGNASASIEPNLSAQFHDLSIVYVGDLLPDRFTPEQIALAFIAALSDLAIEYFDGPLAELDFTDPYRPENPVRLTIRPAAGADPARLIRSNVMWCLKTLATTLFASPSIWGTNFVVKVRDQRIYVGRLDNRNRPLLLLGANNQTGNASSEASSKVSQAKRTVMEQTPNTSIVPLNVPGHINAAIDVQFYFRGDDRLTSVGIFDTIIEFIFGLASRQYFQEIYTAHISLVALPVWIFIMYNDVPNQSQKLHVYQAIALLQAVAQYYVKKQIFQEMVFYLYLGGKIVAAGCVTHAVDARRWCNGLGIDTLPVMANGTGYS